MTTSLRYLVLVFLILVPQHVAGGHNVFYSDLDFEHHSMLRRQEPAQEDMGDFMESDPQRRELWGFSSFLCEKMFNDACIECV